MHAEATEAYWRSKATALQALHERPEAVIAFGGHFNSGKSSLLDALLERDILPVGDLPETGISCRVRSGLRDEVCEVSPSGHTRRIACDHQAIAEEIGAYTRDGQRRTFGARRAHLDISLAGVLIPSGVVWVDSPGINDDASMTARALEAALDADLLVWVLNSRQCLSEPEIDFLNCFVGSRGPEALVLVMNLFLEEDTVAAWDRFHARELPRLLERIAERAPEFGFSDEPPEVRVVSARAAAAKGEGGFGKADLIQWLSSLSGPRHPAIRSSRRARTATAVAGIRMELAELISQKIAATAPVLAKRAAVLRSMELADKFLAESRDQVRGALKRYSREIDAAAESIAEEITPSDLRRDNGYEDALNLRIRQAAPASDLLDKLASGLARHALPEFAKTSRDAISAALRTRSVSVSVADTAIGGGAVGGGVVAGGVLAAVLTGGFALPFLLGGAVIGSGVAMSQKRERDAQLTRSAVREAADAEGRRMLRQFDDVIAKIKAYCSHDPKLLPDEPDNRDLEILENIDHEFRHLAASL